MPSVTFFYRIGNSGNYIGKYVSDISDDHDGLNLVVHPVVLRALNTYRANKGYRPLRVYELKLGVIGCMDDNNYCSQHETKFFDFYHDHGISYLNGREIVNKVSEKSSEISEKSAEPTQRVSSEILKVPQVTSSADS